MNFIGINDEKGNKYIINLDNIITIAPYGEGITAFHCVGDSRQHLPISFDEVQKVIDDMAHRNHRVRIDGLKGETLNVKVVNK